MTNFPAAEFNDWFSGQNFEGFTPEEVKEIKANSLCNTAGVPDDEKLACAKATVLEYIDAGVSCY